MAERTSKQVTRYYIGNRQYVPEESVLLCEHQSNLIDMIEKLYCTKKGAYFLVREIQESSIKDELGTKVLILDEEKAVSFMDEHTAGIITENYVTVLGVPEMG